MARPKLSVGAHVAPEHPLAEAGALAADCVQVFLSDPQGFEKPPPRVAAVMSAPGTTERFTGP
jgi:deoxyribonuclease IV